ncbi:hypothetical protein S83_024490, partial [Arachis hypogaea]
VRKRLSQIRIYSSFFCCCRLASKVHQTPLIFRFLALGITYRLPLVWCFDYLMREVWERNKS